MKQYSQLRESLIKALLDLTNLELTGYIAYEGDSAKHVHPEYTEEKELLMNMISAAEYKMGLN